MAEIFGQFPANIRFSGALVSSIIEWENYLINHKAVVEHLCFGQAQPKI